MDSGDFHGTRDYTFGRLSGVPIPLYPAKGADRQEGGHEVRDEGRSPSGTAPGVRMLTKFLSCPICKDIIVESTGTNCGHKFCRKCLDDWRARQRTCPVCSTVITSQYRLYPDDVFVESQLDFVPGDVKNRFVSAQKSRYEQLVKERDSRSMIKTVRRKLDNSLDYLRSKGSLPTVVVSGICSTSRGVFNKLWDWLGSIRLIILGIIITIVWSYGPQYMSASAHFLQYMWLQMKQYNGEIPPKLLAGSLAEPLENRTFFEDFIHAVASVLKFW